MLKSQLKNELKKSMLDRDVDKTSVLRMVLSAIGYYEIQKGAGYEATDEDVLTVLQREVKQHKDSIEQFTAGNRPDLAEKESRELALLQKYLPAQLSEDEIRPMIINALKRSHGNSIRDMGKIMAIIMPQLKGKADGSLVSKIVKEELDK